MTNGKYGFIWRQTILGTTEKEISEDNTELHGRTITFWKALIRVNRNKGKFHSREINMIYSIKINQTEKQR